MLTINTKLITISNNVKRRNQKRLQHYLNVLFRYSRWNGEHSVAVAKLARDFSRFLKLDHELIAKAALLHDIGKITIPKEILHKPTDLTCAERWIINQHSVNSKKLLKRLEGNFGLLTRNIACYHHTPAKDIDELVRQKKLSRPHGRIIKLVTICDVFEALISYYRPYKGGKTKIETIEIMWQLSNLDKKLFKKFETWQRQDFAHEFRKS